jgi:peptidoglycan/xylan/chitin deacetylase (PgdA/CDA1 family)
MLHRFEDQERGVRGFDPAHLRKGLEYLRRNKYELLSLTELFSRLAGNGPPLRGAVVFTIDDGYVDHANIAGPVFAEFDCPATTFVTTGFLDGALWMWWDKIEYILSNTRRRSVEFRLGEKTVRYDWSSEEERGSAQVNMVLSCKEFSDGELIAAIALLAENAEVDLPVKPPVMYAPMTWDEARASEKRGMTFGPHSVTHPILSRITSEQASWEITESWQRLCAEVEHPLPVFCYPNGQWEDFGPRDIEILRKAGLQGAVVGAEGFADPGSFRHESDGPFKMRRLPFPENLSDLIQYVCGIERCKQIVRGRR